MSFLNKENEKGAKNDTENASSRDLDQDSLIVGPFNRSSRATFDEGKWLLESLKSIEEPRILVDVGAHKGSFFSGFAEDNWEVHAVEPFELHMQLLKNGWGSSSNVHLHQLALSDICEDDAPFFISDQSDGLHSLKKFHQSHLDSTRVRKGTLSGLIEQVELNKIDLLKIDVEGMELNVLKGMCWDSIMPKVILCEYDAAKHDVGEEEARSVFKYLSSLGYHVFASEWHDVLKYGISHDWCGLRKIEDVNLSIPGWGNLVAIKNANELQMLVREAPNHVTFRDKDQCLTPLSNSQWTQRIDIVRGESLEEKTIVFGAGVAGIHACRKLQENGEYVVAFVDNDTVKHGCLLMGLPVVDPSLIQEIDPNKVVLASVFAKEMYDQLSEQGFPASKIEISNLPPVPDDEGEWATEYAPIIQSFKGKHVGEDCFILGNGPSLLKTDLERLKQCHVFGLNKIHLLFDKVDLNIDYHVAINHLVIEQCHAVFAEQSYASFLSYQPSRELSVPSAENRYLIHTEPGFSFSKDASKSVCEGSTVTHAALQLAYYMGFENVFLVGVDHRFKVDGKPHETQTMGNVDENHFDPSYFANMKWDLPDLEGSEVSYQQAKIVFENSEPQRAIFDATVDGALQVFPKIPFDEAVQRCRKKRIL